MGTSGIAFQTLTSGTVAAGNAININNLDAAGAGTFSGGAVTIGGTGGAGADGINITASNSTFNFASATIDNTAGDGIEINGTTPNTTGAVTFTTVNIDGVGGAGVNIVGATNAVNINGGTIGATNDPAGDGVNITGGTGAVTVAATSPRRRLGNEVVDISSHSSGAISFTGAIAASSGGGGIRLVNNSSGNIGFTGDVTLNTGTLAGLTFTNTAGTGANVTFSEGTLDIDTTSGTGINATSTTIGAGSLTISGASNSVAATHRPGDQHRRRDRRTSPCSASTSRAAAPPPACSSRTPARAASSSSPAPARPPARAAPSPASAAATSAAISAAGDRPAPASTWRTSPTSRCRT